MSESLEEVIKRSISENKNRYFYYVGESPEDGRSFPDPKGIGLELVRDLIRWSEQDD